jgi:hypothetical protein
MLTVVLSVSGFFFFISALERGPVTIVSALGGFSGLFILGFVLLFNLVSPGMLIEESSPRILFQKFLAILLLALGLLVLNA